MRILSRVLMFNRKVVVGAIILGLTLVSLSYLLSPIFLPSKLWYGFGGYVNAFHGTPWSFYTTYSYPQDHCLFYKKVTNPATVRMGFDRTCVEYRPESKGGSEFKLGFQPIYFILDFLVWSSASLLTLLIIKLLTKYYSLNHLLPVIALFLVSINLVFMIQLTKKVTDLQFNYERDIGHREISGLRVTDKGGQKGQEEFDNPPTGLYQETQQIFQYLDHRTARLENALKSICTMINARCGGIDLPEPF